MDAVKSWERQVCSKTTKSALMPKKKKMELTIQNYLPTSPPMKNYLLLKYHCTGLLL